MLDVFHGKFVKSKLTKGVIDRKVTGHPWLIFRGTVSATHISLKVHKKFIRTQ